MSAKFYLIHDNSVQWFTKIIEIDDKDENKIWQCYDVPNGINGPFLNSICERELHFTNRTFYNDSYFGWTISKKEFEHLKSLVELYPKYLEYIKLL